MKKTKTTNDDRRSAPTPVVGEVPTGGSGTTQPAPSEGTVGSRERPALKLVPRRAIVPAAEHPVSPTKHSSSIPGRVTSGVKSPSVNPLCNCGCGETTKGGRFKPGHDAKYFSKLRNGGVLPKQAPRPRLVKGNRVA